MANINRDSTKRPNPFTLEEFLIHDFSEDDEPSDEQEENQDGKAGQQMLYAMFMAMAKKQNDKPSDNGSK